MRRVLAVLCLATGIVLAGCVPSPAPPPPAAGPQGSCKGTPTAPADVAQGISEAFGHLGQGVVDQAGRVACCESGWGSNAVNGQYYGLFQIGSTMYPTIDFYSVKRFGYASRFAAFDAWVNSQVARDSYISRGHSWSAFQCQP